MDKLIHITNFRLFNHLPRIYTAMHTINLMVFGVVVSQPVFFIMGLTSFQKSIKISPKKIFGDFGRKIIFYRTFLKYSGLLMIAGLLLILDHSFTGALFTTALLVLLAILTRLQTIQKNNLLAPTTIDHFN